jgi:hypothetical protein
MATVVKGRLARKARAEIGHAKLIHQKLRELEAFQRQFSRGQFARGAVKKFPVKDAEHRATGAGRAHDHLGVAQQIERPLRDRPRLFPIAGIERRLSAAGDLRSIIHRVPESLENLHHRHSRFGKAQVHEAWNEQGDFHAGRKWEAGDIGEKPRGDNRRVSAR